MRGEDADFCECGVGKRDRASIRAGTPGDSEDSRESGHLALGVGGDLRALEPALRGRC